MQISQRPLAVLAYNIKQIYGQTRGLSQRQFMELYDLGEVQLSSVYENLLVETRNQHGLPSRRVSVEGYDFVKINPDGTESILGDMKTTVLLCDGDKRRFVVSSVDRKQGNIYCVGWNWMTNQPNFFCIPPNTAEVSPFPKAGIKIPVHPVTGQRTGGVYNQYAHDSWESMCLSEPEDRGIRYRQNLLDFNRILFKDLPDLQVNC